MASSKASVDDNSSTRGSTASPRTSGRRKRGRGSGGAAGARAIAAANAEKLGVAARMSKQHRRKRIRTDTIPPTAHAALQALTGTMGLTSAHVGRGEALLLAYGDPLRRQAASLIRNVSDSMRLFTLSEFAYSAIDRGYFLRNEFKECLAELRLGNLPNLTRGEWSAVRSAMGRPRRLSLAFLDEERDKLERYRRDVRLVQQGKKPLYSTVDGPFVYQVPAPLSVGQRVSALHPFTRQLEVGAVLTVNIADGVYRVQFDTPDLGVHRVRDTDILPHGPLALLYPALSVSEAVPGAPKMGVTHKPHAPDDVWVLGEGGVYPAELAEMAQRGLLGGASTLPNVHPATAAAVAAAADAGNAGAAVGGAGMGGAGHDGADSGGLFAGLTSATAQSELQMARLRSMALVQQLLDRKATLLETLRDANDDGSRMRGAYSDSFRSGCTWVLMSLHTTNRELDAALRRMRRIQSLLQLGAADNNSVAAQARVQKERVRALLAACTARAHGTLTRALSGGESGKPATVAPESAAEWEAAGTKSCGGLIALATRLVVAIRACSEGETTAGETWELLTIALESLRPEFAANMALYQELRDVVAALRASAT